MAKATARNNKKDIVKIRIAILILTYILGVCTPKFVSNVYDYIYNHSHVIEDTMIVPEYIDNNGHLVDTDGDGNPYTTKVYCWGGACDNPSHHNS